MTKTVIQIWKRLVSILAMLIAVILTPIIVSTSEVYNALGNMRIYRNIKSNYKGLFKIIYLQWKFDFDGNKIRDHLKEERIRYELDRQIEILEEMAECIDA